MSLISNEFTRTKLEQSHWQMNKRRGIFLYALSFNSGARIGQLPVPNNRTVPGRFYNNKVMSKMKEMTTCICQIYDNIAADKCA